MNKNEALNYLIEKRRVTAPFETAWRDRNEKRNQFEIAKKKWNKTIIGLVLLAIVLISINDKPFLLFYIDKYDNLQFTGLTVGIVLIAIAVALLIRKYNHWVNPITKALEEAEKLFAQEANNPEYNNGKDGFPKEFYNYPDIYKLWRLINEGRSDTLQGAYTLLEQEYFYENQMSIQEEIKCLQQDIASSARVTAASSILTSVNTAKIYSKVK